MSAAFPDTPPAEAPVPRRVLPLIVIAQLLGVSSWFAVNAVMPDLQALHGWPPETVGTLTAALQLGFIGGTLVFALLAVSDRLPVRAVFLACTLAAAGCTLAAAHSAADPAGYDALLWWRVLTGISLAGIYPVGMKLAALWFPRGLGAALGWLLGALVLGSASPHALAALVQGSASSDALVALVQGSASPDALAATTQGVAAGAGGWTAVFHTVAALTALGGLLVALGVPTPRHHAPRGSGLQWRALASLWTDRRVRASTLGYYGHMWELYTMWVLVPVVLATRLPVGATLSWAAFATLGAGALGCVLGGQAARRVGSARVAATLLAGSGACCLAAPWMLDAPLPLFAAWLLLWGFTVAGDSPQFSALTASNAPVQAVGSVLTLSNSIGFAISAASIALFVQLSQQLPLATLLPWLGLGPLLGLWALRPLLRPPSPPPMRSAG